MFWISWTIVSQAYIKRLFSTFHKHQKISLSLSSIISSLFLFYVIFCYSLFPSTIWRYQYSVGLGTILIMLAILSCWCYGILQTSCTLCKDVKHLKREWFTTQHFLTIFCLQVLSLLFLFVPIGDLFCRFDVSIGGIIFIRVQLLQQF